MSKSSTEDRICTLVDNLVARHPPDRTVTQAFLGAQFDAGLAWVHNPPGEGGLGLQPRLQKLINERLHDAGATSPYERNPIGHGMCAPTLIRWGTAAQKKRYLRPLFTGKEVWCQLFSEPGAGSDVANLATRAVEKSGEWVVNGQKVWTTLAHRAKWGLLMARTDPDVETHAGLSAFVVDMHAPGIEVRPLRQMGGDAEFNEVFLNDVRVPRDEILGTPGNGWSVAITTLMNERVSIGGSTPLRGSGHIAALMETWRSSPAHCRSDTHRDEVMALWVRAEVLRLTNIRARQMRKIGDPGPEGSTSKLASAELNKDIYAAAVTLLGASGMLYNSYALPPVGSRPQRRDVSQWFLRMRANSIEGGTTEIMKNIIGERVLGLPPEPRPQRGIPWKDLPR